MTTDISLPFGDRSLTTGEWLEVRSPFDNSLIARVPKCDETHVAEAVAIAKSVHDAGALPVHERAAILDRAVLALSARVEEFAQIIAAEAAKPIKTARVEAQRAISTFQFAAVAARTLAGEMVPLDASVAGAGKLAFTLRVPIGVVGAISPFNFPLNLVAHKLAPAIAAGCPVVLKPASQTPVSAIRLVEMLMNECGLPAGHINVVTGGGTSVGNAIVEHDDIAMITFTGSPEVGWGIRAKAARKKVGLELGNNAPVIIEPTGDWETAATKIAVAGFSHAGQSCISTQRIFVHETLVAQFTEALVDKVKNLVVGDPLGETTDVSALISTSERDRVHDWVKEAESQGAVVRCGGEIGDDGVLRPTVVSNVSDDMKVCSQEIFGPVVGIASYSDFDDALCRANTTRYGLQAAVFTSRLDDAMKAAKTLDFGGVCINEVPTFRADQQPYGGLRDSGNTREGPKYAVEEMTEARLVIIQT